MCRNHRGFVDASLAVAKLGADLLYLNTAFAGPQLVDVLERERPRVVIHDEEFAGLLDAADIEHRLLAWADGDAGDLQTIESLIERYPDADLEPPGRHARIVILTSGTTGTPEGRPAQRGRHRRRRSRCCRGCRCATAGGPTSPPRCSTPGASPTWRWRCCWARRSCCAAGSTPRSCLRVDRGRAAATRWW